MAVAFIRMGSRLPFLKKKVLHFAETHKEKLENIDKQIAPPSPAEETYFLFGPLSRIHGSCCQLP